jgi:pimeloyl-ACP methyl ester carboxylesterase
MATYQTAPTSYRPSPANASTTYAYRFIGPLDPPHDVPNAPVLLFLPHFRGTMDLIDPLLINTLATQRRVLLTDYVGVGKSSGTVASTAAECADQLLDFLAVLGEKEVDVLGFSVGGRIAQLVALNASAHGAGVQVRKLIIAGATSNPVDGNGIQAPSAERAVVIPQLAAAPALPMSAFQTLFFSDDAVGKEACERWWKRLEERNEKTSGEKNSQWLDEGYQAWDDAKGIHGQATILSKFDSEEGSLGNEGSWDRLPGLDIPVLVANGSVSALLPHVLRVEGV